MDVTSTHGHNDNIDRLNSTIEERTMIAEPFVQVQLKKLLGLEVIYIHSSP